MTSENLSQFIDLAKNFRIHEFDNELYQLKKYFDIVMTKNEITSILRPNELKHFVCGEPDCPVEQMKNLVSVNVLPSNSHVSDFNEYSAKMTNMFWNVIESFSVEERIGFIRFTSGSNGLPAVGLNWQSNLKVNILSKEETQRVKKILPEAQTCFSTVKIFYFENEEQLAKVMRTAILHRGLITDEHEIPEGIENFI